MKKIRQLALVAMAVGLMAGAPLAQAVPFSITSASLSPGSGYGQDPCEKCGTLLDTRFDTSGFVAQNFSLNSPGASHTFNVGTVALREADAFGGIGSSELDRLGVSAYLVFANPLGSLIKVLATGTAYVGAVSDAQVDYTLTWNPVFVSFGAGGQFELSLSNLVFSHTGPKDLVATVTLWTNGAVPEPGTLALLGLGMAGLGLSRRRRSS